MIVIIIFFGNLNKTSTSWSSSSSLVVRPTKATRKKHNSQFKITTDQQPTNHQPANLSNCCLDCYDFLFPFNWFLNDVQRLFFSSCVFSLKFCSAFRNTNHLTYVIQNSTEKKIWINLDTKYCNNLRQQPFVRAHSLAQIMDKRPKKPTFTLYASVSKIEKDIQKKRDFEIKTTSKTRKQKSNLNPAGILTTKVDSANTIRKL